MDMISSSDIRFEFSFNFALLINQSIGNQPKHFKKSLFASTEKWAIDRRILGLVRLRANQAMISMKAQIAIIWLVRLVLCIRLTR